MGCSLKKNSQVTICADNGVLFFDMADYAEGEPLKPVVGWETPTSDICFFREAGKTLAAAIEPFHGNQGSVYECGNGAPRKLAAYDISFGHAVWIGRLCGKPALILGSRAGEAKALEIIPLDTGERLTLESGAGPTQLTVYEESGVSCILSANHESGEVVLYKLREL